VGDFEISVVSKLSINSDISTRQGCVTPPPQFLLLAAIIAR
jgi:hypothetical protein